MATLTYHNLEDGVLQVSHTDWTAAIELAFLAFMIVFEIYIHATFASVTVVRVDSSTKATDTTFITMIDLFLFIIIIKKIAYVAKVPSEAYLAINALLRRSLQSFTFQTLDHFHLMSW